MLVGNDTKGTVRSHTAMRSNHSDLLAPSRPLSDTTRLHLLQQLEAIYALFKERVAEGRPLDLAQVEAVAQGRVYTGAQALDLGLIDGIGGLQAAVQDAKGRLGLAGDADVAVIPYPRPRSILDEVDNLLRQARVAVQPQLPFAELFSGLDTWLGGVEFGSPALIPPFWIQVR